MAETTSYYKKVVSITITDAGSGYDSAPNVIINGTSFNDAGFTDAKATAVITNGFVTAINVVQGGSIYTSPPSVVLTGGNPDNPASATAVVVNIDSIYGDFKNSLSYLIANQLPDYVRNEFPQFVLFLEKYYEFLDQEGQVNNVLLNADKFSDINRTLDTFLPAFKQQYLQQFPDSSSLNDRTLVKFIRDFYESKGSEKSVKLLFRMLYDEEVEVLYPSEQILIPSDGIWTRDLTVKFVVDDLPQNPFDLIGKTAKITYYKTVGSVTFLEDPDVIITDVRKLAYVYPPVYQATILRNDTTEILIPGAGAVATAVLGSGPTAGKVVDVTVTNTGNGYYAAPVINFISETGSGATARAVLNSAGELIDVVVLESGSGYTTAPAVEFDTNPIRTHIHLPNNLVTKYGYLIRILSTIEIGAGLLADGETNYGFAVNDIYQIDESGSVGEYTVTPTIPTDRYFATDYVKVGVDNNAAIKIDTVNANGLPTQISIFYTGYSFEREYFDYTITSPNGSTLDLTFKTGSQYTRPGSFKNSRGFLSDVNKLQDNYYYQNYSYVIRSGIPSNNWMNVIKNTVHPAGMAVFSELVITETIDYSTNITAYQENVHFYEFLQDEEVTVSDTGLTAYVVTFFKAIADTLSTPTDAKVVAFTKVVADSTSASTDVKVISVGKNVSDSATSSDAVNSVTFSKVLTDSVTITDAVLIGQLREYSDSVTTPTDAPVVSFGKVLADSITTPTDDDVISVGKVLADSVTAPTDSVNNFAVGKNVSDASTVTDDDVVSFGKNVSDASTVTDDDVVSFGKIVSDSITTPTDDDVISFGKNVSDSISAPTDTNIISLGKVVSDSITAPTDTSVINIGKVLTDSVNAPTDAGNINIQDYFAEIYTEGAYNGVVYTF